VAREVHPDEGYILVEADDRQLGVDFDYLMKGVTR